MDLRSTPVGRAAGAGSAVPRHGPAIPGPDDRIVGSGRSGSARRTAQHHLGHARRPVPLRAAARARRGDHAASGDRADRRRAAVGARDRDDPRGGRARGRPGPAARHRGPRARRGLRARRGSRPGAARDHRRRRPARRPGGRRRGRPARPGRRTDGRARLPCCGTRRPGSWRPSAGSTASCCSCCAAPASSPRRCGRGWRRWGRRDAGHRPRRRRTVPCRAGPAVRAALRRQSARRARRRPRRAAGGDAAIARRLAGRPRGRWGRRRRRGGGPAHGRRDVLPAPRRPVPGASARSSSPAWCDGRRAAGACACSRPVARRARRPSRSPCSPATSPTPAGPSTSGRST